MWLQTAFASHLDSMSARFLRTPRAQLRLRPEILKGRLFAVRRSAYLKIKKRVPALAGCLGLQGRRLFWSLKKNSGAGLRPHGFQHFEFEVLFRIGGAL